MTDWRVNETRKRSLLKAISFRLIEIGVDTGLFYLAFTHINQVVQRLGLSYIEVAFGLAVIVEVICLVLHYLFERIWNKIEYGREIVTKRK